MTAIATFTHIDTNLNAFAPRLLDWFAKNGRHDLPWQQHQTDTPNPYIVWLSEVMLQQTQVATVLPYFTRFIHTFPTVQALAAAEWHAVAEHWAGLGYYARARNLHKGAKQLVDVINETGDFPQTLAGWEAISGVGPSTAGAIMAMGLHKYGVICDGNVKRVLTRWAAIDGDITKSATTKILWDLAARLTPTKHSGLFAQAMMDMGATLCSRSKPACLLCPLKEDCLAHAQGRETDYPVKAKKPPKPSKFSTALLIQNSEGDILWLQRPDNGIWGGLWSLPLQFEQKTQGKVVLSHAKEHKTYESEFTVAEQLIDDWITEHQLTAKAFKNALLTESPLPIKHSLTHFHWYLSPKSVVIPTNSICAKSIALKPLTALNTKLTAANITFKWLSRQHAQNSLGLPRAMVKILESEPP